MSSRRALFVAGMQLLWLCPAALGAEAPPPPPGDGWVVWQSYRSDGRNEVYRARADGSEVTRLTMTGGQRPMWSPDGRWVSYSDELAGVHAMRPDGSEVQTLSESGWAAFWQHDGAGLVLSEGAGYVLVNPDTRERTPMFAVADFPQFAGASFVPNAMTHDNRYLLVGSNLYMSGYTGTNGSFKADFAAMLLDLTHKDRVYFLGNGCWPFTPPEGDLLFHVCGDCPQHPDIYRMNVADLATRASYEPEVAHPDPDWGHEYNPRVSTDNKWIVYMTSTGCHDGSGCDYEIFLHRLGAAAGERSRVTTSPAFDGYPDMYVGPLWTKDTEPPALLVPRRLTFFATAGQPPAAQRVQVRRTGAGGAVQATATPAVPGVVVDPVPEGLSVRLDEAALRRGTRHFELAVQAEGVATALTLSITLVADDSFPEPDGGPPGAAERDGGAPDAREDAGEDPPAAVGAQDGGGCGCSLPASRGRGRAAWLGLLFVLIAARSRRRSGPRA